MGNTSRNYLYNYLRLADNTDITIMDGYILPGEQVVNLLVKY